jgi:hypothetical protein
MPEEAITGLLNKRDDGGEQLRLLVVFIRQC